MKVHFPEHWQQLDELFDEALQRPPDERTAFLRARCGDDRHLYAAILSLIEQEAEAEQVLGDSATDFAAPLLPGLSEALGHEPITSDHAGLTVGTLVGRYRIVGELGRGGMGAVYRAERADGTFEKEVALKVVKRGMDTDEMLRRFRYERRLLASLDHPHIARLLDAGATDDGRPFLVMELAEGERITTFADRRKLGIEARVSLLAQVIDAVRYAHRRLVVHRDLKPSNVLVVEDEEGKPHVKLLDFGIAKLLETDDGDITTRPEQRVLTPEYAAPEQRRGEPATTATDVYALGVMLHELLVGQRPKAETQLPSSQVRRESAEARNTTKEALRRHLRGDLDTITLMALHQDSMRRYTSADALLDDLDRRRKGLPLGARPDTAGYRIGRFVGRHRVGAAASVLSLAALLAFVGLLSVQQQRTTKALGEARATADFLESLFAAADPFADVRLDTLRASDLLARGADRARRELGDEPELQARLLSLIGTTYMQLDLREDARPLLEEALRIRLGLFEPGHEVVAETRRSLGNLDRIEGRYDDAEAHLVSALATYRDARGSEHQETLAALKDLAYLFEDASRYREAEALLSELVATQRRRGDDRRGLAGALHALALVLRVQERYDEAEPLLRESLVLQRDEVGPDHPNIAASLNELGAVLRGRGDLEGAEDTYRQSLEMFGRLLGPDHRQTAIGRTHLAELLKEKGQYAEAAMLYRHVLEQARQTAGPDHPGVGIITALLAGVYLDAGRFDDAEVTYRDALGLMARALPAGHIRIARATNGLGATLLAQGRFAEAETVLLDGHGLFEAGGYDPDRAVRNLVRLYDDWGNEAQAARWRKSLEETDSD